MVLLETHTFQPFVMKRGLSVVAVCVAGVEEY